MEQIFRYPCLRIVYIDACFCAKPDFAFFALHYFSDKKVLSPGVFLHKRRETAVPDVKVLSAGGYCACNQGLFIEKKNVIDVVVAQRVAL